METPAQRLGRYVLERREKQLDLTQLDVHAAGGPSNSTQTEIENGRLEKLTRVTRKKLDAGLRWEPGSAQRVWDGGEPTPLSDDPKLSLALAEVEASNLSAEVKDYIKRSLREDHANREGGQAAG